MAAQLDSLLATIDADHNGVISYKEFKRWMGDPPGTAARLQGNNARLDDAAARRLQPMLDRTEGEEVRRDAHVAVEQPDQIVPCDG